MTEARVPRLPLDEAKAAAQIMLSNKMVSYQTGPEGVPVNVLIVAPGVDIAK